MNEERIVIRGARQHNLKNIDLSLPKGKLTVITGVSGSGKSSLAFDTLFAEGRRRYLESLSAQARLFLQSASPPDVDSITGLSPAIAIEQKGFPTNPRSTVGTLSEILDHLRILFTHLGKIHCPRCDRTLEALTIPEMARAIAREWQEGSRLLVLAPLAGIAFSALPNVLRGYRRDGFSRIRFEGSVHELDPLPIFPRRPVYSIDLVVDRLVLRPDTRQRLMEALELALKKSGGLATLFNLAGFERHFSENLRCPTCNASFEKPEPALFSFHHPRGACHVCKGLGHLSPQTLSSPGKLVKGRSSEAPDFPLLSMDEDDEEEGEDRTAPKQPCPECLGTRFNPQARSVRLDGLTIHKVLAQSLAQFRSWVESLKLSDTEYKICERPLKEILARLEAMSELGLDYLTLDRPAATLSGGEVQRLRIAHQVTSPLSGILYVLDEPSIGLHMRDHHRLLNLLFRLRDAGNTLVVVEHDRATILAADHVVELGPGAGEMGGELLYSGPPHGLFDQVDSPTAQFLSSPFLSRPRDTACFEKGTLSVRGARGRNLKNISARFPLGCLTCVTGVSGSGKSSLVIDTLHRALAADLHGAHKQPCPFEGLEGHDLVSRVLMVDQKPIGRTPRSSPATYSALFNHIRRLFSQLPESRARGYTPNRFSFNVKGGRCESCKGNGVQRVEMFFLPDVHLPCPYCSGKRFNSETLAVTYKGRSIAEVLDMTFMEAGAFFRNVPSIAAKVDSFIEVGLGYLKLGQPAATLSGGEAQRIKLATQLSTKGPPGALFILDEPTTGLHFADIQKLMHTLRSILKLGHTVIIIEHHPAMILASDYVIEMGPEGGQEGGYIVAEGTPDEIAENERSVTGAYLRRVT